MNRTSRNINWRNYCAFLIGIVGAFQILGYITGSRALKGIGAATVASPLPKVFSDVNGLETFASEFILHVETESGEKIDKKITPELYGRLNGPYNRRNVYGAALSYAPRLPEPIWQSVFCYGLRRNGPLRKEFGLPDDTSHVTVSIQTKTKGRRDSWLLDPPCD